MPAAPEVLERLAKLPNSWGYEEMWLRGRLRYLMKPDGQLRAYDFIHNFIDTHPGDPGPIVLNCHRGFGKSALEIILGWEFCLKYPGWTSRYATPDVKLGEDIMEEILSTFLIRACPPFLRPVKSGNTYTFRNPRWNDPEATSRFILIGCHEHAERQRGKRSNFVGLDELRQIRRPKYVCEDVFAGHFIAKERPLFVITSTPPKTTGHYFTKSLIPWAQKRTSYVEVAGSGNDDFTAEDRQKMLQILMLESHEEKTIQETPAYQREIECKLVADRSALAIPEFYASGSVITKYIPPSHFYPVVGIDFGHIDYNAALMGICDFQRSALVIRQEFVKNSIATSELAEGMKEAEYAAWGHAEDLKHQVQRWADNDPQCIYDLSCDYGLTMAPVVKAWKAGKWASLNALRTAIKEGRIIIHSDCVNLIFQLENAEINDARTDFVKPDYASEQDPASPILGHADALMALVYLWKMCHGILQVDPFPPRELELGEFRPPRFTKANLPQTPLTEESSHITGAIFGSWRANEDD